MLFARIITALFLIPTVIGAIFYLPLYAFSTLLTLVIGIAYLEMGALFWQKKIFLPLLTLVLLMLGFYLSSFLSAKNSTYLLIISCGWWLLVPYILTIYTKQNKNLLAHPALEITTALCTFLPCFVGFMILKTVFGATYVLYVLLLVWAADIGAYFAGRFLGHNLLAAKISPKKTIEGALGGLVAALLVAISIGIHLHFNSKNWISWIMLVIIVTLWSIIGDLFESMLKRVANVKDSGTLLPGHGGFYDRIDSLTSAVPIFALGLLLLGL